MSIFGIAGTGLKIVKTLFSLLISLVLLLIIPNMVFEDGNLVGAGIAFVIALILVAGNILSWTR